MNANKDKRPHVTRRELLGAGTSATALSFVGRPLFARGTGAVDTPPLPDPVTVELKINGRSHTLAIDPRTTLLDVLREHLGLTGAKKGCDQGQCGACTVILNGRRINSCLTLAVMHAGDEIITIEGLADDHGLHPLQASFVRHDALQCGYCTPGQICSAVALLAEHNAGWPSYVTSDVASTPTLTDTEIAERMSGNICRCSAYPNIVAAIRDVLEEERT